MPPTQIHTRSVATQFVIFPSGNPKEKLYSRYFPEEINLSWATQWAEMTIPGRRSKAYQYVGGGAKPFNFKLMFDRVEKRNWFSHSPGEAIAWFDRNVPANDPSTHVDAAFESTHNGVFTVSLFGKKEAGPSYQVLIRSVKGKIAHYSPDGEPLRLEAELETVEFEPLIYTSRWKRSNTYSLNLVEVRDITGFVNRLPAHLAADAVRRPSDSPAVTPEAIREFRKEVALAGPVVAGGRAAGL